MKPSSLFIVLFMSMLCSIANGQEICENGLDDDADGFVDMADTDCFCYNASAAPASLITNSSFEQMSACPSAMGDIELATGWQKTNGGTPDYFNCDYKWKALNDAGIDAYDGTGYVGALFQAGFKEYLGTCLSSPMLAGKTYQINMHVAMLTIDGEANYCDKGVSSLEEVEVTVYGNKHCSALNQPNNYGCPMGGDAESSSQGDQTWFIVGTATYKPSSNWEELAITFVPTVDVSAIMIGAPCTLPDSYKSDFICSPYMVYDNITLVDYSSFFGKLEAPKLEATKTTDCEGSHYTVTTNTVDGATHYWVDAQQNVTEGESIEFDANGPTGIYSSYYIAGSCTSEVAKINPFEQSTSVMGEGQKETIMPNVMTPNGDGVNDVLDAQEIVAGCLPFELSIVDRWGGLVYTQTNGGAPFNGRNQGGAEVNDGVYFYSIKYQGEILKASLTVLR